MTEDVHHLVYYSRNRLAGSQEAVAAEIDGILAAARRNNPRVGVTGALMFNAGCFAQVLEGPRAAVEATFERIQQDERHGDVFVLTFAPAPKGRAFGAWSMAFVGVTASDVARYGRIAVVSGFDPASMTGGDVFETVHRMVLEEEFSHG